MKSLYLLILSVVTGIISFCTGSEGKITELQWRTPTELSVPESVCYDAKNNRLYVSNINGKPAEKNGAGFITMLSIDGKIEKRKWITDLNAPKGMGILNGFLYVTDIDRVVKIDIAKAKVVKYIDIPGTVFLNDIAAGDGTIYVSDMGAANNAIYRLQDDVPELLAKDREISAPNGLYYLNGYLLIGNNGDGKLKKLNLASGKISTVVSVGHGIDGVIALPNNEFLISDWQGKTEYINSKGKKKVLVEHKEDKINAADIEYIPEKHLLLIPTFFGNTVEAYTIKY